MTSRVLLWGTRKRDERAFRGLIEMMGFARSWPAYPVRNERVQAP